MGLQFSSEEWNWSRKCWRSSDRNYFIKNNWCTVLEFKNGLEFIKITNVWSNKNYRSVWYKLRLKDMLPS